MIDETSQNDLPFTRITKSDLSSCDILFFNNQLLITTPKIYDKKNQENNSDFPF